MNQRLTASQAEKTKKITMIGLMTAVTCILGPLSLPLPFSPVPITLTNFAVFLPLARICFGCGPDGTVLRFCLAVCTVCLALERL